MNRIILFASAALAAVSALGDVRALTPDPWGGAPDSWQMKRHQEKLAEIARGGAKVVFVGDSITHFWETNGKEQLEKYFSEGEAKMLDLGTSADRTEHVLWRLTEGGELDGYAAKIVFLMIGTNNAGHFPFAEEPPTDAILGIREILRVIREKQPEAKVVLTAIFPRGKDANDPERLRNDVVNREIMRFADGKTVFWCDLADDFLSVYGRLSRDLFPDLLHPNALGYELWYAAIKPYLDYALSEGKLPAPANRYAPINMKRSLRYEQPQTVFPASRIRSEGYGEFDWWLDRLAQKRREIVESNGAIDLVLFGDSITHNWESIGWESLAALRKTYSVLDLGYSGDRTQHLVWRGSNGELDGYAARCVMLMIGTNNQGDAPEDVAAGVREVLNVIMRKQPEARILLLPVFPRGEATSKERAQNRRVNELIRPFADGRQILWIDFTKKFLDHQGDVKWIMPDRLHPNAEGYSKIWLPEIAPILKMVIGK